MSIPTNPPLLFSSYRSRSTMGDLHYFKPGDKAVMTTLTRHGQGYLESSNLINIIDIAPHHGKTINGVRVNRNHEKNLTTFDEVDQLTYQIEHSRASNQPEQTMLYGEYTVDHGLPGTGYKNMIQINQFDADGKPYYVTRDGVSNETPPAKIIRVLPFEDYVSWSVETRNELTNTLANQKEPFWKRLLRLMK